LPQFLNKFFYVGAECPGPISELINISRNSYSFFHKDNHHLTGVSRRFLPEGPEVSRSPGREDPEDICGGHPNTSLDMLLILPFLIAAAL
jgi:hypothetical protein